MTQREFWELRRVASALKGLREAQGLSLSDMAERTGMDRGAISRLENNVNDNPTIATLSRYARALGKRIVVTVEDSTSRP